MAIAFDAQSASGFSGGTTLTWSHTCSGSDRILIVGVYDGLNNVTGVTYNGTSLTACGNLAMSGGASGQNIRLFYLINPSTGANNCVVSASASGSLYGTGMSYTGAKQTGQPDSQNTGGSASTTSLTVNTTTVADNSWLVGFGYGQTASAGTGTTFRGQPVSAVLFGMDSNGAKSPAGSYGLNFTQSANFAGMCVASISPAASSATFTPKVTFF